MVSDQDIPRYPPLGVLTIRILSAPSPPDFLPLSCCGGRRVRHASATGQGLTLVPISAQLELTLPVSAQLKLTLSPA